MSWYGKVNIKGREMSTLGKCYYPCLEISVKSMIFNIGCQHYGDINSYSIQLKTSLWVLECP